MQSILFPMNVMRITQAYGPKTTTHKQGFPIDIAAKDTGIESAYAPFDGVIKKIYKNGNSVWLESTQPVKYADGTVDYAVAMFTHDDNVNDLRVGQVIKQGQNFYQEGKNNATANHVHFEIGGGKFTGTGWKQISGQWVINNAYRPEKACFLKNVTVLNAGGLKWTTYKEEEEMVDELQLAILYRFLLGSNITEYGYKNRLGKQTFKQAHDEIRNSEEYKKHIQSAKSAKSLVNNHLPQEIR